MRRPGAVILSALLATGCSSGGASGGGGGTVVTPTPTPSSSPSPTPTPSASYTKFAALTGDQTFLATCNSMEVNFDPPAIAPVFAPGNGIDIAYQASSRTWDLTGYGVNLSFGPADLDSSAPEGNQYYAHTITVPGSAERFRIHSATAGGSPIEYFRLLSIVDGLRAYSCVTGVSTKPTDVPAGVTINYSKTAVSGAAYRTVRFATTVYSLNANSTATISVNLATGKVTTTIRLVGVQVDPAGSSAPVDLGTITNVASIDAPTAGYYGHESIDWSSSTWRSTFAQLGGRFFGPQGAETGAMLTYKAEPLTGGADERLTVSATIIGIR
ncbi:hypothetical protein [Sphingomonas canadensis]|nr:hypothetical protein [Sphingomonas canadensis]